MLGEAGPAGRRSTRAALAFGADGRGGWASSAGSCITQLPADARRPGARGGGARGRLQRGWPTRWPGPRGGYPRSTTAPAGAPPERCRDGRAGPHRARWPAALRVDNALASPRARRRSTRSGALLRRVGAAPGDAVAFVSMIGPDELRGRSRGCASARRSTTRAAVTGRRSRGGAGRGARTRPRRRRSTRTATDETAWRSSTARRLYSTRSPTGRARRGRRSPVALADVLAVGPGRST